MDILLVCLGLAGLVAGGDLLVRHAVAMAQALNVSPMVIGLTLVGFGTSTPELVTSLQAASAGSPGIALGNVIGSNIANVMLILGASACLAAISVRPEGLRRDGAALMLATLAAVAVVLTGQAGRLAGAGLVLGLLAYLALTLTAERRAQSAAGQVYAAEAAFVAPEAAPLWRSAVLFLLGLGLTLVAARMLVGGAISMAAALGVSETVIGLTVVAVGTSMPELVTSVMAARRGQGEVALGNVIGSNIFNVFGILGVTALVQPLAVPDALGGVDLVVLVAATLALVVMARTGWRVTRREGVGLVLAYCAYTGWLVASAV